MLSNILKKYPVLKTMSSYLLIYTAADMNEQIFIKKRTRENYDTAKTARISFTGGFILGPMVYVWIRLIERLVPGKTVFCVLKKVAVDGFGFAPIAISTFYVSTNILEGKKDLTEEWKQKFYPTWATGLMYWPIIQTINFAFIPLRYKTSIYMPAASFLWMNYLCFMKDKKVGILDVAESNNLVVTLPSQPHGSHPHTVTATIHKVEDSILSKLGVPVVTSPEVD